MTIQIYRTECEACGQEHFWHEKNPKWEYTCEICGKEEKFYKLDSPSIPGYYAKNDWWRVVLKEGNREEENEKIIEEHIVCSENCVRKVVKQIKEKNGDNLEVGHMHGNPFEIT